MDNEFKIDEETGKVYEDIRIEAYNSTTYIKQEVDIDINKLIPCQCMACPCHTIVLKRNLICKQCWERHEQSSCFKTIVVPREYNIPEEVLNDKKYYSRTWTNKGWKKIEE